MPANCQPIPRCWGSLAGEWTVSRPSDVCMQILGHVGFLPLADWAVHFAALVWYRALHATLAPTLAAAGQKLPGRQRCVKQPFNNLSSAAKRPCAAASVASWRQRSPCAGLVSTADRFLLLTAAQCAKATSRSFCRCAGTCSEGGWRPGSMAAARITGFETAGEHCGRKVTQCGPSCLSLALVCGA